MNILKEKLLLSARTCCTLIVLLMALLMFASCGNPAAPAPTPLNVPQAPSVPSATATPAPTVDPDLPANYVVIYVGNQVYDIQPLKANTYTVDRGEYVNKIRIYENGVYMESSTCDNQDCVHQGEITLDNYEKRVLMNWVVCLPNQVSIELIVGEPK